MAGSAASRNTPFPAPRAPGSPPAREEEKGGFTSVIRSSPESEGVVARRVLPGLHHAP